MKRTEAVWFVAEKEKEDQSFALPVYVFSALHMLENISKGEERHQDDKLERSECFVLFCFFYTGDNRQSFYLRQQLGFIDESVKYQKYKINATKSASDVPHRIHRNHFGDLDFGLKGKIEKNTSTLFFCSRYPVELETRASFSLCHVLHIQLT